MKYGPEHIINGKYKLLESVGNGTMGEVYKAEHLTIHKIVAVKILHQNMTTNPEVIERFKREAQAAAAIEDSHVCAVSDFDVTEEGDFYLVMEFLEGETLLQRIAKEGKLPPQTAVGIMQQLLSVLQCAHDHGIVHRDVKPENIILINRDNIPDFVKLLDFGIAHQDESFCVQSNDSTLKTQLGYLYGTPQYLSPEQATGSEIDYRADLYSCGIVLFEMLTGTVPFQNPSTLKVLHMQAYDPPPHLPVDEIECGKQFDEIIQRLLEKEPQDRYPSAAALKEALNQVPLSSDGGNTWGSISISMNAMSLSDTNNPAVPSSQAVPDSELGVRRWLFGLTRQHFIILVVTASLVILMLGVVLTLYFVEQGDHPSLVSDLNIPSITNSKTLPKPQPFEFFNADFAFSYDPVLLADSTMTKALEEYNADRFEECLKTLDSVYPLYKEHPNYLRLRLLVLDKMKNREEAVKTFIALCKIIPRAPLNASVSAALYNIVEDKAKHKDSIEQFKTEATPELAMAFSEAILQSPYDRHDIRRERLATIYKAMPIDTLPQWRQLAVEAWTEVDKDKCEKRQEVIQNATRDPVLNLENNLAEFYISLIVPLHENNSKLCKKRNKNVDCNACMRDWIDERYEVLTNKLAGLPDPLLKNIEKVPETKHATPTDTAKPEDANPTPATPPTEKSQEGETTPDSSSSAPTPPPKKQALRTKTKKA